MKLSSFSASVLALLSSFVSASPTSHTEHGLSKRAVIPPSQDPFYLPPSDFSSAAPGDIIRHREVADAATAYGKYGSNIKAAYQIMYRSTNSIGNPEVAVTTLFVPNENAHPERLVAYQTAYDASYLDCSPSSALQLGSGNMSSLYGDFLLIASLLNRGFFVTTADYEGLHAAYTAGPQAAYATLDSVRAVLKSSSFSGLAASGVQYALWGYSGGALACEWAAEFQPSYAPELKFIGAALGGLTPNITSVYYAISGHIPAGLAPPAIIGLSHAYANFSEYINNHLVPANKSQFLQAGLQCYTKNTVQFAFKNITKFFTANPFDAPVVQSVISVAGIMGLRGPPKTPLYVYKAIGDEVSPIADTEALVGKYCANGVNVVFHKNSYGGHEVEGNLGAGGALNYLLNRFDGVHLPSECTTATFNKSTFNSFDMEILGANITAVLAQLTAGDNGLR